VPTLADLIAAAEACDLTPELDPRPILGAYDLTLALPADAQPGDGIVLEVRPGIYDRPGGGLCGVLRGRTERGGQASETVEIATDGSCLPVPEAGFVAGLLAGVLWAIVLYEMGRRLREIGRQYRQDVGRSTRNSGAGISPDRPDFSALDEPDDLSM